MLSFSWQDDFWRQHRWLSASWNQVLIYVVNTLFACFAWDIDRLPIRTLTHNTSALRAGASGAWGGGARGHGHAETTKPTQPTQRLGQAMPRLNVLSVLYAFLATWGWGASWTPKWSSQAAAHPTHPTHLQVFTESSSQPRIVEEIPEILKSIPHLLRAKFLNRLVLWVAPFAKCPTTMNAFEC